MGRIIDLPEISETPDQPVREFDMPKKRNRAATGCAVVIIIWASVMALLLLVAATGGLARLAFWAVGA